MVCFALFLFKSKFMNTRRFDLRVHLMLCAQLTLEDLSPVIWIPDDNASRTPLEIAKKPTKYDTKEPAEDDDSRESGKLQEAGAAYESWCITVA